MKTLTDIIYKYKDKEFSYPDGLDCVIFSLKIAEEYTEKEIIGWKEITTYKTYKGALKTIKKLGCKDVSEVLEAALNIPRQDISQVKLGDIVHYVNEQGRGILGVCNGVRAYFLQEDGGITARRIEECDYCWSIS